MWTKSVAGIHHTPAWDHDSGDYQILLTKFRKPYRLVSVIHEDEDGNFKVWDFETLKEAQDYADLI